MTFRDSGMTISYRAHEVTMSEVQVYHDETLDVIAVFSAAGCQKKNPSA